MWELDNKKKGWALKNWCLWTVVLEKTLERPLDSKEIKPVNPKGNQPWISVEGLMLKLKLQCFGHLGKVNTWHSGKDSDAGKDWGQDGMVGWHHRQNGNELEQTPRDSEGQGSLARRSLSSVQFSSVAQSCPTLCNPMNCSTPGLPVYYQLPEFPQTHVHRVNDAIQPSHPLSSPSPPAPNPSQHQSLFQWVNSSHEVAKVLEFQL